MQGRKGSARLWVALTSANLESKTALCFQLSLTSDESIMQFLKSMARAKKEKKKIMLGSSIHGDEGLQNSPKMAHILTWQAE